MFCGRTNPSNLDLINALLRAVNHFNQVEAIVSHIKNLSKAFDSRHETCLGTAFVLVFAQPFSIVEIVVAIINRRRCPKLGQSVDQRHSGKSRGDEGAGQILLQKRPIGLDILRNEQKISLLLRSTHGIQFR